MKVKKIKCGWCEVYREEGDICCEQQARNQGQLHFACSHPPPEGTSPHLVEIYEKAAAGKRDKISREENEPSTSNQSGSKN